MDRGHDAAILVLYGLAIAGDGNLSARVNASVKGYECGPAEKHDEKGNGDDRAETDLAARVARFRVNGRGEDERVTHAAFSADLGALRRATTSLAGPIIRGLPSSRTSRRSTVERTPRRCAMTMTVAPRERALAIVPTSAASPC